METQETIKGTEKSATPGAKKLILEKRAFVLIPEKTYVNPGDTVTVMYKGAVGSQIEKLLIPNEEGKPQEVTPF